jgi:hypothetical protein
MTSANMQRLDAAVGTGSLIKWCRPFRATGVKSGWDCTTKGIQHSIRPEDPVAIIIWNHCIKIQTRINFLKILSITKGL